MLTAADLAELEFLSSLVGDKPCFAIDLGCELAPPTTDALARLVARDYVRFVDVAPMRAFPGRFFRSFVLTEAGQEWFAANRRMLESPASRVPS